ncbi:hypothetical protein PSTG_16968 [Puccinia striiformis f. sp. tritici PST-78]|uniref:Uncharacterized protein n=1 Tax=Puccinia striiformis f. sp. tritici PST-78 TaxID=1165861 RepID=A0A0L0URH6_9BASI|nr:hypothetical protein PSTG_16968 [Puccinia striiformis f. sp. tritici PST-78]
MVGKNAVELDIQKDYAKLHPVFNVSLIVRYFGPNDFADRGVVDDAKEKYYTEDQVVDWTQVDTVLDARVVRKAQSYLLTFRALHQELFGQIKKKQKKV